MSDDCCNQDHDHDISMLGKRKAEINIGGDTKKRKVSVKRPVQPTGFALEELSRIHEEGLKSKRGLKPVKKVKHRLYEKHKYRKDETHVLDRISRVAFPLTFVLFNGAYCITMFIRQRMNDEGH